jgi:hypothetical protein
MLIDLSRSAKQALQRRRGDRVTDPLHGGDDQSIHTITESAAKSRRRASARVPENEDGGARQQGKGVCCK